MAWDACLKETGQELQLRHDYDMLMMFEQGIRGGITHIAKRYSETNNEYMKDYDPNKPSKYIQYLDANNLYWWAMSQRLPTHGFKWLKDLTVNKEIEILNQRLSNHGYIFNLKLIWNILRNFRNHNDYPIAPEKLKVDNTEKLVGNFYSRIPTMSYTIIISSNISVLG